MTSFHYRLIFIFAMMMSSFLVHPQQDSTYVKKLLDEADGFEVSNPKQSLKTYQNAYHLSLKINYPIGAYKSLLYSGIVHSNIGNFDSALYYYKKNIDYCVKEKIQLGEAKSYANIANVFQFKGDYTTAVKYYLKSITLFEKTKDSAIISQSYQNLAAIYTQFKNKELEFFYLKKAETFVPKLNLVQLGLIDTDIASGLINANDLAGALLYLKKAEAIAIQSNDEELWFYVTRNFGDYFRYKKEYKKAIYNYEKALKMADKSVDLIRKNDLIYIMSAAYLEVGNYSKALFLANQSLDLAKKIKSGVLEYKSLKRIATIYNETNQPQKAYTYLEESYNLMDTVFSQEHLKETTLLQTRFETEKKDKSLLQQQIQFKKQELILIKSQKQKQFYLSVAIGLLLLSLGIWLVFRQRQRAKNREIFNLKQQQEIAQLEALIDGEEKERRRIAQELHDGINGDLSAVKYRLSGLEDDGLNEEDRESLTKTIEMIDSACSQIRGISHNLMPSSILDFGLVESVNEYCSKINNSHPLQLEFQYFGNPAVLPKKAETVIYRIIQELINNITKHSKATTAIVQLNFHESELFITVEDNGIGFDPKSVQNGLGLKNIDSRVHFLNAQLEIDSNDRGASFHITIDLNSLKND